MYIVKKKISGKEYYYLRESVRKGKKVVSKNVAYLGKTRKEAEEKMKKILEEKERVRKSLHILFVCKGNKFRSKIAELLFKKYNKNPFIEVKSAGTEPAEPAKKEIAEKIKKQFELKKVDTTPRKLNNELINWAELIIITADNISLSILNKKIIRWDIPDTKEENYDEVVGIIKLIEAKVKDLIGRIKNQPKQEKIMEEIKEKKIEQKKKELTIDELAAFCKRKGFVFKSSEIYGGFAGFWDFGNLGVELFNNIKQDFWKFFVHDKENMTGIDTSIISHPKTWEASGHIKSFKDYAVVCKKCKKATKIDKSEIGKVKCECGGEYEVLGEFSLLFKTNIGALNPVEAYLRGETAQGMFLDFKQVYETSRLKLPFGIAQIGRCFRNEIAPRDFLFRDREFTIAEFEFFIHPEDDNCNLLDNKHLNLKLRLLDAETQVVLSGKEPKHTDVKETTIAKMLEEKRLGNWHAYWLAEQLLWFRKLGLLERIKVREHLKSELAHYSSATFDIDYEYPFGSLEIAGIANRGQFDLKQHEKYSGEKMEVYDEASKKKVIPRVIEPTFGIDRVFLALICQAYNYDEKRENIVLKLPNYLAPIKAAIFPIVKGEQFEKIARQIYSDLKKEFRVIYDDSGSIGRRYARNDEISTPYCITIDGDSIKGKDCTIRNRDNTKQIRVKISELKEILRKLINSEIEFEKAGKIVETRVLADKI